MDNFLLARHWQLFLLMVGLSIIGDLFTTLSVFTLLSMGVYLAWLWALAINLQRVIPPAIKMKTLIFKIFCIVPIVYLPWAFYNIFNLPIEDSHIDDLFTTPVICAHLLTMVSVFYCMYFAAKTVRTAELQRKVIIDEYATVFLMIGFFPIGIWLLQPRVNRLMKSEITPY
jgi:hypothetical protein